jgi:hypothetical protein
VPGDEGVVDGKRDVPKRSRYCEAAIAHACGGTHSLPSYIWRPKTEKNIAGRRGAE